MPTELYVTRPVDRPKELTGRHVLLAFVSFFAVVFAVNAYFISVALSTHTGVVAIEPYRKGIKYNDRIAAADQQASLGWREVIALSPDGQQLTLSLNDGAGQSVRGLAVSATVGRPATTHSDVALTLTETAAGQYQATAGLSEPGAYIATIEASDPTQRKTDIVYRARARLWLKP